MFPQPTVRKWILFGAVPVVVYLAALAQAADTDQAAKPNEDLGDLTLEQLVNVKVTSVSKEETDLFASPAAISVVTADDIRRLGITSFPRRSVWCRAWTWRKSMATNGR